MGALPIPASLPISSVQHSFNDDGTTNEPAYVYDSYDQETGRLASSEVQTGVSPVTVDATSYSYDNDGNVTAEADTPLAGVSGSRFIPLPTGFLEPIAMFTARSILSFIATSTATQCSAALPTIATTIAPMKNSESPIECEASVIEPTRTSDMMPTRTPAMPGRSRNI